jgi:hypothetical protein
MKNGEEIMAYYRTQRDYSGSVQDSYAQDLETFFHHAFLNNEVEAFYQLLIKAEKLNKLIGYKEPEGNILYDDYFMSRLILVDKKIKFVLK